MNNDNPIKFLFSHMSSQREREKEEREEEEREREQESARETKSERGQEKHIKTSTSIAS